ncbi:MAG: response regulator transcription factor [Bacteroidaceae bacterium]|nr:response regulator transcription factor [Bacteroidaceae bacterium]
MEKKRILVVDDEQDLCEILTFNLQSAGYEADAARSAEEALMKIEACAAAGEKPYDLLLLDVMMPGISGFEMARQLRAQRGTRQLPIIFLTARDSEDNKLTGFELGADDYVTKPFSVREVMARVKAVLGRARQLQLATTENLSYEGLTVDAAAKTAIVDGEPTALTPTEYELLSLLMEHGGKVLSRQQLLERVWPHDVVVTERTVDVNIARLRKKLKRYGACLVARTGFGYCFEKTYDNEKTH